MAKFQLDAVLNLVDVQINPQVFRKISQQVAGLPIALQNVTVNLKSASVQAGNLNTNLKKTASTLTQNERAASLFLRRMAQFAILLPTFATLNRAIQGSVSFLMEFDSALRDIVRTDVKGLAGQMEAIGDAALKTAVEFGVVAQEVLNVTKVFVQAGLSIEDSQERARLAILATQVSTLQSADAVEFFIAATKQFNLNNEQLISALDALVRVEDLAAVEAQDIAEAFRTGGNSMAEFGKDINDAIGLISALREQTRKSGREIGTFFKTLQTRIFAAGESRDAVEALGVSVQNLDGSLRPTLDVLNDLKKAFDGLNEAQAANAAKSIGGVRQFESLIATLNSLERANELSQKASEAAGTADLKRTVTDEKLERQLGKLIAQGQAFAEALGDAGLQDTLAKALKLATGLLERFTKLADIVAEFGGNLTPLLALAGVKLGQSVFGLTGFGAPGGGAGKTPQPGQANFVGPLTQAQSAISSAGKDLKRLGSIASESAKFVTTLTRQIAVNTTMTQAQGLQLNIDTQALKVHTTAIKTSAAQLAASTVQSNKNILQGSTALLALTLSATFLPKVFDALENSITEAGKSFGTFGRDAADVASNFTGIAGAGATMATQFAALGPHAAALAGAFGVVTESLSRFIAALDEHDKAIKELTELDLAETNVGAARGAITRDTPQANEVFNALAEGVKGKQLGNALNQALTDAFTAIASSNVFSEFKLDAEGVRTALLSNIGAFKQWVDVNKDNLNIIADNNGRLEQFNQLMTGLNDGTLTTSNAFSLLLRSLGAGEVELSAITGNIKKSLDFSEFKDVQKIIDFADEIRSLGQDLALAKLGPKALSDDLVRLEQEFMLVQRASDQTGRSLNEQLGNALTNLSKTNFAKNLNASELLKSLLNVPENLDQGSIERFKEIMRELPKVQREAAEEVLKIVEQQLKNELELQKAENSVVQEQQKRAKAMLDVQTQATQNAFESTRKFTAELMKFGDAVNKDVLQAFQNLSTTDIEDVLANKSDLADGLQQIILGAFGDDKAGNQLAKAQTNLNAVTDDTAAKVDILTKRLEIVNTKLADTDRSNEKAALTAEKLAIELELEQASQEGMITATEAKIKVLEAERDVIKAAKEAEERRLELTAKLADATRQFNKELRDSERSFQDLKNQKIADLFKDEQEAQGNLKEAQQDVLDSTQDLADKYEELARAQLEFGNALAEARVKSNLLARDIDVLTGGIVTFDNQLDAISNAFNSVLDESNITLQKRIDLERQLAEETLAFLQQARDSIVQAGIGIFGQTGAENQALGQGIAGLQMVADQLGGSFEAFLNFTSQELSDATQTLLSLPAEFRQQILDALSFLPSTTNIGGFSVDQLREAIGQVGAGVAPEVGLPSIEDLTAQQVEQLQRLQDLALQDAQLQFAQVIAAQEQVDKAEEQLEASKLLEERAAEGLEQVHQDIINQVAFLETANQERRELLNAVIEADDRNTLSQIEQEAQLFAEQNVTFREVGENIVRGISAAIGAKLNALDAAVNLQNAVKGYIPNFAGGSLTPGEAAGLLRAGAREKRAMPAGAGLAVANTSEAIIPMNRGYVPNFQEGNFASPIAAGIEAIRQVNSSVVAAISQSITQALTELQTGDGSQSSETLTEILAQLTSLNDTLDEVNTSNAAIQSNTATSTTTPAAAPVATGGAAQEVRITLQTNQNNTVTVTGLESLRTEISNAVRSTASEQVDAQLEALLTQLDGIITALQERGLLSSINQSR